MKNEELRIKHGGSTTPLLTKEPDNSLLFILHSEFLMNRSPGSLFAFANYLPLCFRLNSGDFS